MESSTKDVSANQGAGETVQKGSSQQQQQQQNQQQQNQQQFNLLQEDKQKLKRQLDQKVGTAPIKLDFIDYSKIHLLYGIENIGNNTQPQQPTEGLAGDKDSSEPPAKKAKKKNRGQNKKRPFREKRIDASLRLCPKLIVSEACQYGEKCMFSHDVAKIVQGKEPDLGLVCYNFDTYGKCQRGIMCRYGSSHITADYKNVIDEEKWTRCKDKSVTKNNISWDVKNRLWKRKMKYAKSDKYLADLSKTVKERIERQRNRESSSQKLESKMKESVVENNSSTVGEKQDEPTSSKPTEDVVQNERTSTAEDTINAKDENVKRTTDKSSLEKLESSGPTVYLSQSVDNHKPQTSNDHSGVVSSSGNQLPCQSESSIQQSGVVTDEDLIKLRSGEKKTVDFRDKLYLAPLTTVGNLPFRRVCKGFGADITCGEMAICTNLLQGQVSEWALLKRHSSEDVFGVQNISVVEEQPRRLELLDRVIFKIEKIPMDFICRGYIYDFVRCHFGVFAIAGAFPDTMTKCAELLNDTIDIDFLDINVGCPIDIVYNKGAGCGLMNRVGKFEDIVRGMSTVLDVPLTVKMRTGIYDKHLVAVKMIPRIYNWGASAVTLHGRTREQRYTKSADWDYITQCVKAAEPHPLLGNGDILSFEDANLFKEKSGVAGMMIARGALIKPWIFTEIKEQRHWDISSKERFDYLQTFVNYGLEHWGSDTEGVEKTRRFLLEWLSFLYRYIPVGVLERVPQQINQRPPHYIGRNDLETLMASANFKDWITISEMLLGPVPNNFQFLPKHKANSYN